MITKGQEVKDLFIIFITKMMSQLYICQNLSNCTLEQVQLITFQLYSSEAAINNVHCRGEWLLSAATGYPAERRQARPQQPPCRSQSEPPAGHGDSPRLPLTVSVTHVCVGEVQSSFQAGKTKARNTEKAKGAEGPYREGVLMDSPLPCHPLPPR